MTFIRRLTGDESIAVSKSQDRSSHRKAKKKTRFSCDTCGKSYAAKYRLGRHMMIHLRSISCKICNIGYVDETNFFLFQFLIRKSVRNLIRRFSTKKQLITHKAKIHNRGNYFHLVS